MLWDFLLQHEYIHMCSSEAPVYWRQHSAHSQHSQLTFLTYHTRHTRPAGKYLENRFLSNRKENGRFILRNGTQTSLVSSQGTKIVRLLRVVLRVWDWRVTVSEESFHIYHLNIPSHKTHFQQHFQQSTNFAQTWTKV